MTTTCAVAEQIAQNTWARLGLSWHFNTRLGEETLTDLLVLDLVSQAPNRNLKIFPTSKIKEATQGTDLVVCVHRGGTKADVYAIQAKKLYPSGQYDALNARSGNTSQLQINTLERYAAAIKAIPLYLLYNHVDGLVSPQTHWHCCKSFDKEQFGCTLAPSWCIRRAISFRGCRTFDYIHSCRVVRGRKIDQTALPWRCAFCCPGKCCWEQIRAKAEESHGDFLKLGRFSDGSQSEILRDLNFESGQMTWPGNLWEHDSSFPSSRDMESQCKEEILELFGSRIEVTDEAGSRLPPNTRLLPRWLLLVGGAERSHD